MTDRFTSGHGISVSMPTALEGRIYRRATPTTAFGPQNRVPSGTAMNYSAAGGDCTGVQARPMVHLANFPMPADRDDGGSGAVKTMAGDALGSLIEFGPELLGTALYLAAGPPRVTAAKLDPNALQRRIPGQAGMQYPMGSVS